jgi:hypothetical protein
MIFRSFDCPEKNQKCLAIAGRRKRRVRIAPPDAQAIFPF